MRGFDEEQREEIEKDLIETGRELLVTIGPSKTTIQDITEPIGIGTSSFYLFFDSKDELYLEIIQREITKFQERLEQQIQDIDEAYNGLKRLFTGYVEFSENNGLIQSVIIRGDYQGVFQKKIPDQLEQHVQERMTNFLGMIERLQAVDDGYFSTLPPDAVLGVMSTLGIFVLHRDRFELYSEGYYQRVKELLIETLARGLVTPQPGYE